MKYCGTCRWMNRATSMTVISPDKRERLFWCEVKKEFLDPAKSACRGHVDRFPAFRRASDRDGIAELLRALARRRVRSRVPVS